MSYIKKIRIKNFKNLEDVEIDFTQLTFLFGPNGSGKSSFIQALMFLSNNIGQCFRDYGFTKTNYILNNGINLGSFKDIVTESDTSREIVFEILFTGKFEFFNEMFVNETINYEPNPEHDYNNEFDLFHMDSDYFLRNEYSHNNILDYSFKVCYTNSGDGYDLESIIIKENINNSQLKTIFNWNGDIRFREFSIENNKVVTDYFQEYLGYSYDMMEDYKPFSLNLLPAFRVSCYEKKYNSDLTDWFHYSQDDRIKYCMQVFKLCYVAKRIIPNYLMEFLSFKHLPAVRERIKASYSIDVNSSFAEKDYFDLLDSINKSKSYLFDLNDDNSELIESLRKCMIPGSKSKFKKPLRIDSVEKGITHEERFYFNFDNIKKKQIIFYNTELFIFINYYLNKFGFKLVFDIKTFENTKIISLYSDIGMINASNSSSGFMQIFPIIICCCMFKEEYYSILNEPNTTIIKFISRDILYSNDKFKTLLIEQPELHLHPKLQSQLAELFSDTVQDLESNTLIIETHSEHLIRKLQVLIAKGEIDIEKVGVWYFDNSEGITKIKEMKIEENGLFKKDWPKGFFDDSINLTMELYDALRKRKN